MKTLTKEQLDTVLKLHKKWLDGDIDGVRADLSDTDLSDTDLINADLIGAILRGAILRGAYLSGVTGNNRELNSVQTGKWQVVYTAEDMAIGCQQHSLSDWWSFDDKTISNMDENALTFWRKWKPILMQIMGIER